MTFKMSFFNFLLTIRLWATLRDFPGGPVGGTPSSQCRVGVGGWGGAGVPDFWSLFGELDPTCHHEDPTCHN